MDFTPHRHQQLALDSKARFIACISGVQGGKTTLGAIWFLREIYDSYSRGEKGDWLIVAPTVKILNQSTLVKFREWFPKDWGTFKEQKQCFELAWGGRIFVRSADEPDYLEGMTIRGAWLDEAGQMSYEAWINIQARLSIYLGRAILTTTPYTQVWLKRDIIKKAGRVNEIELPEGEADIHLIEWTSVDNTAFPKQEFERMRRTLSPELFARRYLGKFTNLEGLVYKSFDADTHIVQAFPIPAEWRRFSGADFGHTVPTAILVIAEEPEKRNPETNAVITPSKYYVYSEFYKVKPLLVEVSQYLERENPAYCLGDPRNAQEMDEIRRYHGFKAIRPADNKIDIGIERIDSLLRDNRLFFFAGRTVNTLREITEYHYPHVSDEKENRDKPVAVNNHAMDALKYAFSRALPEMFQRSKMLTYMRTRSVSRRDMMNDANSFTGYF